MTVWAPLMTTVMIALGTMPVTVSAQTPAPAPTSGSVLTWTPCGGSPTSRLECATVRVPLDHARPHGRKIDIAISRLPATDPAKRRGIMLTNPGGPGGSGLGMPEYVEFLLSGYPQVFQAFDVIGFDPRFVGRSTPVSCGLTSDEISVVHWSGAGGFDAELARARSIAEKCVANAGWALPFARTVDAARDMDRIRAALGERRTSFLGYSYGSTLGRAYAGLFPTRVDRFVMDSNTHPTRVGRDEWRGFAPQFERMLGLFSTHAAGLDPRYGLGTDPDSVRQTFDAMLAKADSTGIPSGTDRYTGPHVRTITFRLLYAENRFDLLGRFLGALRTESALPADIAFLGNLRTWEAPPPFPADNSAATFHLTTCGDDPWPTDIAVYRRDYHADQRAYPFLGAAMGGIGPCAFWPRIARESAPSVAGHRLRFLLINSTGDPATPYDGAVAVRAMMPRTRLVTVNASHHAVLGEYPNACVENTAATYLTTGVLPATDRTC